MLEFMSLWALPVFTASAVVVIGVAVFRIGQSLMDHENAVDDATKDINELSAHIASIEKRLLKSTGDEPMAADAIADDTKKQIAAIEARIAGTQRALNNRISEHEAWARGAHAETMKRLESLLGYTGSLPTVEAQASALTECLNRANAHADQKVTALYKQTSDALSRTDEAFKALADAVVKTDTRTKETAKLVGTIDQLGGGLEFDRARREALTDAAKGLTSRVEAIEHFNSAIVSEVVNVITEAVTPLRKEISAAATATVATAKNVELAHKRIDGIGAHVGDLAKAVETMPNGEDLHEALAAAKEAHAVANDASWKAVAANKTSALAADNNATAQKTAEQALRVSSDAVAQVGEFSKELKRAAGDLASAADLARSLTADVLNVRESNRSIGTQCMTLHDRTTRVEDRANKLADDQLAAAKAIERLAQVADEAVARAGAAEEAVAKVHASSAAGVGDEVVAKVDAVAKRMVAVVGSQSEISSKVAAINEKVGEANIKVAAIERAVGSEIAKRMDEVQETRHTLGSAIDNVAKVVNSVAGAHAELEARVARGITDDRVDKLIGEISDLKKRF